MALIVCPECGKEVSDKCEACIHCGYPLVNTKCNINGVIYDFKAELPIALLERTEDYISSIGQIRRKVPLTLGDACEFVDIIRDIRAIPESYTPEFPLEDSTSRGIECPYCHSKDTKKISGFSKAVEVGLFGILAMDTIGKQWHCNHCGSDF